MSFVKMNLYKDFVRNIKFPLQHTIMARVICYYKSWHKFHILENKELAYFYKYNILNLQI
jgi:hypothetical protein